MVLNIIAVLFLLLSAVVVWVLAAPFSILADTYRNEYYLSFGGIGKAELIPLPGDILIRLKVAFWKKDFYPLHPSKPKKRESPEAEKEKKSRKKGTVPFRRIINVLKSFHIKHFRLEIDTDDYIRNAYLWPAVYGIKPLRRHVSINFDGRNECRLLIQNRIGRMAWAWWRGGG